MNLGDDDTDAAACRAARLFGWVDLRDRPQWPGNVVVLDWYRLGKRLMPKSKDSEDEDYVP